MHNAVRVYWVLWMAAHFFTERARGFGRGPRVLRGSAYAFICTWHDIRQRRVVAHARLCMECVIVLENDLCVPDRDPRQNMGMVRHGIQTVVGHDDDVKLARPYDLDRRLENDAEVGVLIFFTILSFIFVISSP